MLRSSQSSKDNATLRLHQNKHNILERQCHNILLISGAYSITRGTLDRSMGEPHTFTGVSLGMGSSIFGIFQTLHELQES